MSNVLKMEKKILIEQLLALGWSYRKIETETGIRRETVAKYDPNHPGHRDLSKPAKVPPDPPETQFKKPILYSLRKPTQQSLSASYNSFIREELGKGLTGKRIYQDLVTQFSFHGSYDSVKRFIRKVKEKHPEVFARIHTAPGEEAEVDFAQAAATLKNNRWVKPWLFKMVLSYSRHSFEEVVWGQDVETFIRCHEHAFEDFGGVPKIVKLDNLKSGVLIANLYDPELNPAYAAFAEHAGFVPFPCRPRMPHHKGKVESGVGYTKSNALKGLKFDSLDDQNAHLRHWNRTWARTRIHGTTKRQVWPVFKEIEQPTLQALPQTPYQYFKVGSRIVHFDGHIEVDGAYYSVPPHLVRQELIVHYNTTWIKVLQGTHIVAFHRKTDPGRFKTEANHLPPGKSLSTEQYTKRLLKQCSFIGSQCHQWATQSLKVRKQLALRAIQGVIHLKKRYTPETIDQACSGALQLGALRYHTVKLLCEDNLLTHQYGDEPQLELLQNHEIIRPINQYSAYADELAKSQITGSE